MKKAKEIPRIDELPDIFDLLLAGQLLGYNTEYLRQQSIKGNFPGYQLFGDGKKGTWRVNKEDLLQWLEDKRAASKWAGGEAV